MNEEEIVAQYKVYVTPYVNENGWFPDTIMGDEFWCLIYCRKHYIDDELWWEFVD